LNGAARECILQARWAIGDDRIVYGKEVYVYRDPLIVIRVEVATIGQPYHAVEIFYGYVKLDVILTPCAGACVKE
jgi:hypothetical protein